MQKLPQDFQQDRVIMLAALESVDYIIGFDEPTPLNLIKQIRPQVLVKGGELWVIGNRHLGYHAKLKHLFGNCEVVASNKKFTLLKALKK